MKSCIESLLDTTKDYENKELIVVDNASIEAGTSEYLQSLQERGFNVIRRLERDPANEYAIGLNQITNHASGDYVCMLQGDMQFVVNNWLHEVVEFYDLNLDVVGSYMFDAQRRMTIASHDVKQFNPNRHPKSVKNRYFADLSRDPIAPAADAMYSRRVLEQIAPWSERNVNHEGSLDSENEMRFRIKELMSSGKMQKYMTAFSAVPQSIAIYTDPRGTQGRVRGNKRYGQYWEAKDETRWKYYEYVNVEDFDVNSPRSIEEVAKPIGFQKMLDERGNWLKNPIRPETAKNDDWIELT
jgi:glycosyltransferase involved in cell wall biosynthesis